MRVFFWLFLLVMLLLLPGIMLFFGNEFLCRPGSINGGYGYRIRIDHGNGMVTLYAHCSSLEVGVGEHVYKGQLIAYMGSTGISTGSHCHFGVYVNGTAVDPLNYL